MDYKKLMLNAAIPWHNPDNLTPEQVDPANEGWRLITKGEIDSEQHENCGFWNKSWLHGEGRWLRDADSTIRTREPLPPEYAHLVEPEIPAGLPPLPEPPAGCRWAYRRKGWEGQKGITFCHIDPSYESKWIVKTGDEKPNGIRNTYYVEAVKIDEPKEPDYSDPEYRRGVEEAYRNGAVIQDRHPETHPEWRTVNWLCGFNWNGGWEHRIAPNQPAKPEAKPEPDYDSTEHKLAVLIAQYGGDKAEYTAGKSWYPLSSVAHAVQMIDAGFKVRIKPAKIKRPLTDYRVSEWVKCSWYGSDPKPITAISADWITIGDRYNCTPEVLLSIKAQIHRDGKWVPCYTEEEQP